MSRADRCADIVMKHTDIRGPGRLAMSNFDRKIYFDAVRKSLFSGSLSQQQVDGQEAILGEWEVQPWEQPLTDVRWLAYMLATTLHETASKMWPVEEYGKGSGMEYGKPDPETGQTYYGRGYVQLTWRDNYRKATVELGLKGDADLEWHAEMALEPQIAADIMFRGMAEGWFRSDGNGRQTLLRYFDADTDDPYGAREIINGDRKTVPDWSNGVSIGNLIAGYHREFLAALEAAAVTAPLPPVPPGEQVIGISVPDGVRVMVNGNDVWPMA